MEVSGKFHEPAPFRHRYIVRLPYLICDLVSFRSRDRRFGKQELNYDSSVVSPVA
jgi:hypothetical protein